MGELAALKAEIEEQGVQAIFTEIGTPGQRRRGDRPGNGAEVVEASHTLPDDGSYFSGPGTAVADVLS